MTNIIYLKDYKELAYKLALTINSKESNLQYRYSQESISKAIQLLSKDNLRYDIKKGITYLKREWIEKSDAVPEYEDITEVIEWQFAHEILNVASKLEKGILKQTA